MHKAKMEITRQQKNSHEEKIDLDRLRNMKNLHSPIPQAVIKN
jgi:hypothetical protein